jgi:hypothetical protein
MKNTNLAAEFIFENKENIPDGFYVDIMESIQQYHRNGGDTIKIHKLLNDNKNNVNDFILERLDNYFPEHSYFEIGLHYLSFLIYIF